jgi:hypothetical protein
LLCVALALVFVWAGLTVTYYSKFPVGFLITAFAFTSYLAVRLLNVGRRESRLPDRATPGSGPGLAAFVDSVG